MLAIVADDLLVPMVIACASLGSLLFAVAIGLVFKQLLDQRRAAFELEHLAHERQKREGALDERQRSIDEDRLGLDERKLRLEFDEKLKEPRRKQEASPRDKEQFELERERMRLDNEQTALERERHALEAEARERLSRSSHPAFGLTSLRRTTAALLAASVAFFLLAVGLTIAGRAIASPPAAAISQSASTDDTPQADGEEQRQRMAAEIDFVDVGQGDAIVMRVGGLFIVSDAGDKHAARVDSALRRLGANVINVAILSHPNRDHVANFLSLLTTYGWTIETAVASHSDAWNTGASRRLMRALRAGGTTVRFVTRGRRFLWGGAGWEILNPPTGAYTSASSSATNNASVAYTVRINGIRALFTGDIGRSVARQLAERWLHQKLGRVAIFLATHHGSKNGSIPQLLAATRPKWAVLSTGPNPYGHPSAEAVKRLEHIGASIWCTDANGTVAARVSIRGRITWTAARQLMPWWSAPTRTTTGVCVSRPRQ